MRRTARGLLLLACLIGALALYGLPAGAQQLTLGKVPVSLEGSRSAQYTLKVDYSTTPNRVELGCETDQLATATVNGLRITGGATGVDPTLTGVACTGGDTNRGITISPAGTGNVTLGGTQTTWTQVYSALEFCRSDNTLLVPVRVAANDWGLGRTAAGAETYNIHCAIPLPWRTTASKGARLDSFGISQLITTAALTSNTFNGLAITTYANNVADAVAAYGGAITITMPTAVQANPYLTPGTVGTPAFMTTANAQVSIDFTVVMQNLGVYRLNGISVTYSTGLY